MIAPRTSTRLKKEARALLREVGYIAEGILAGAVIFGTGFLLFAVLYLYLGGQP